MAKKREKTKTSPVFLGVIVVAMLTVFLIQMVFPTNLGKTYDKLTEDAVEITVTVTGSGGEEDEIGSYYTDSTEEILALGTWADSKKMRNRSLADGLNNEVKNAVKYNFAIRTMDDTYNGLIIDEIGFVHTGAELYKISGDVDEFLHELKAQLESWENSENRAHGENPEGGN